MRAWGWAITIEGRRRSARCGLRKNGGSGKFAGSANIWRKMISKFMNSRIDRFMKSTVLIRWIACCIWLMVCITACSKSTTLSDKVTPESDITVSNNLQHIIVRLYCTISSGGEYPKKLSGLVEYDAKIKRLESGSLELNPNDFVCPGTGTHPGRMTNVDEWTDYIYVGGASDGVPGIALLISPPENHHGEYGYVVTEDKGILRLPPGEVRALVKEPWLWATNTDAAILESVKRNLQINIPVRLRSYYTNANTSTKDDE